jgi:hypothetical protein
MKRFLPSALLLGSSVAFAADPVSVYPPTVSSTPTSLNQSLPQALLQAAPAVSAAPTMTSSPTWAPTATACTTPTYLNCNTGRSATSCEPKYTAMPGCSPGPSLTRPYVNLLQPPGWLNRCDDGTCSRGNLLERLGAWLSSSRSAQDAPGFTAQPLQAPMRAYFPCQPTAAGCGTCGTAGPVEGGRLRTLYIPLVNRFDAMPTCTTDGLKTATRPNLLQRMLGFFTPEGFGFSSGNTGSCATGTCGNLGSTCTEGRVRYANPMTHANSGMPSIRPATAAAKQPASAQPTTYPGTLVPVNPVPTGTPAIMPSSYMKPVKVTPATQPLTNP